MSKEYDKYWKQREELQSGVSKTVIKPISFEIYKKSPEERLNLKIMKKDWKNQNG